MSKGNDALQRGHDAMAEVLAAAVTRGVPVKDETTGEIHYAPISAAHMTVLLALCKHNNITAIPVGNTKGLGKLIGAISSMPIPGAEVSALLHGADKE